MSSDITLLSGAPAKRQAVVEIARQNDFTASYGLALTQKEAVELIETRSSSLENTGRLEFGAGAIGRTDPRV